MKALGTLLAVLVASEAVVANQELVAAVARRLAAAERTAQEPESSSRRLIDFSAPLRSLEEATRERTQPQRLRHLQGKTNGSCDAAFMKCLESDKCVGCFVELESKDIDWASVTADTPCEQVVKILNDADHCAGLRLEESSREAFCHAFDSCVTWEDSAANDDDDGGRIDCSQLTECRWDGMHDQWLGDGICHDKLDGCYNTEICGWDGGDCCEDTCKTGEDSYVKCGHEEYACRNPNSPNCKKSLNPACPVPDNGRTLPPIPTCKPGTMPYRMVMYDSFGDGWDSTKLEISDKTSINTILYTLELRDGAQGTEYICLSKTPACYHVETKGGVWGREVSWEVKPLTEGAPSLGSGGAPMACDFPVAGSTCDNTCTGRKTDDPTKDPDYKDFKSMTQCIDSKCPVQIGACESDDVCVDCFKDIPADYCYADDFFNALLDCAICKCTETKGTGFCETKNAPGIPADKGGANDYTRDPCSPAETVQGGNAVLAFGKCAELDQASLMITDFDQNNFGMLDSFEACAHSFKNKPDRGGHTALQCLQILVNAKDGAFEESPNAPKEAIQALASHLYDSPQAFCDCASKASEDCPLCPSFMNFKTLLYESLDACQSLDEIDCNAWAEFYPKCKANLVAAKGSVNFGDASQCKYVQEGCGGAGAFPVFRRLDCNKEVSVDAWSFYGQYANSCLSDQPPVPTPPVPTPPAPIPPAPTPPAPAPTPARDDDDYVTPVSPSNRKPYISPEDQKKSKGSSSSKPKRKSHFFRNMFWLVVVVAGGVYYYKNYGCDFSFLQRYRRFRPVAQFENGDMYSGLTMESSTTFQPPTLPPTPVDMGSGNNNGGHYI